MSTLPDRNGHAVALDVEGLGVRLSGQEILRDVTFDVAAGSWVCAIGPNGAGKTTLLHAVAGLVPFEGRVDLWGRELGAYPRRERARLVALVTQQPVIPEGVMVKDYVLLGRTPHLGVLGTERRSDLAAVERALERLDLVWAAERRLDTLSGGELQRVVLARALAQEAPLLLLDEPTTGLDLGHQIRVLELVDELRRERALTILSAMHDLTLAGQFPERLLLLDRGRAAVSGTAGEVLTEERIRRHYGATVRVIAQDSGEVAVIPMRAGS